MIRDLFSKRVAGLVFVGIACLTAIPAAAQESEATYQIMPVLEPGEYALTQATSSDISTQVIGRTIPYRNGHSFTWNLAVEPQDEAGKQKVILTLARVRSRIVTSELDAEYDSDKAENSNPQFKHMHLVFRGFMKHPFTVTLDANGKVIGIDRFQETKAAILATIDEPASKAGAEKFLDETTKMLSQNKNFFTGGHDFFPPDGAPVKVGETWKNNMVADVPTIGAVATTNESTLQAVDVVNGDPIATVATKAGSPDLSALKKDPNRPTRIKKAEIGGTIVTKINLKTRQLLTVAESKSLDVEVEMPNPQNPQGPPLSAVLTGNAKSGVRLDRK